MCVVCIFIFFFCILKWKAFVYFQNCKTKQRPLKGLVNRKQQKAKFYNIVCLLVSGLSTWFNRIRDGVSVVTRYQTKRYVYKKKKYLYQWWNTQYKFCPMAAVGKTTSGGVSSHVWKQYVVYFEAESRKNNWNWD